MYLIILLLIMICSNTPKAAGQDSYSTSDVSIPGLSNKYNTDKTIKALIDLEHIPLVRMENEHETFKAQKDVWLRLNNKISNLRKSSKELYGFQNPFDDKIAESSNKAGLTATAVRAALEEESSILIKQIAASDRFISHSLPADFNVPRGLYRFQVGNEEVKFTFQGGSLKELVGAINKRAGSLIKATMVDDTKSTQVLVIEAKKTGEQNRLIFHDQALALGEQAGILERSPEAVTTFPVRRSAIQPWESALEEDNFRVSEGILTLNPGTELKIPLPEAVNITENMVLELEISTKIIPERLAELITEPPGPTIPEAGGIEFQGIRVQSSRSRVILPEWKPPEPPVRIDDLQVLFVSERGRAQALNPIRDSEEFYTLRFEAPELPERIDSFNLRNRNTHRIIKVKNIRIFDKTARGDYRPRQPLSTAQDANIVINGIEAVRETNSIDDLIPGVNLTLHSASAEPVKLKIGRDLETIKDSLIRFIGIYNQLLVQLDILTRQDESIIENARYLEEDERERARQELGLFQGNMTLNQLKSSLQRIMMNPYPTGGGRELSLLTQVGIATDAGSIRGTAALDRTRLRGYMQIDEAKLDEVLSRQVEWVKDIFGYDTDKDLVIDSGIGVEVDNHLKSYVERGGIINNRVDNLNNSISRKSREIDAYNRHLEDYERGLRKKFGTMEAALDRLEQSSRYIDNLNRQNK